MDQTHVGKPEIRVSFQIIQFDVKVLAHATLHCFENNHSFFGAAVKDLAVFSHSTIGKLEPSYVIRKFLDAQRIHNLTAYLQALHRQSLANADHTTLLLNCYTKLKDSSKLEEFIKVKHLRQP